MASDTLARLRTLTRQGGSRPATTAAAEDDALARLRRMQRVRGGQAGNPSPRQAPVNGVSEETLADRLGGTVVGEGLIRIRAHHALPAQWGEARLGLPGQPIASPEGLVFLDTETTGLAGGSGTLAFLVGLVRVRAERLELDQYLMTRYAAEGALLRSVREVLGASADAWVTYNGKSYDLPLLETRSRMQGQGAWVGLRDHLDLMHAVRRGFAHRWSDCRLVTAESRLLGVHRRDDLPGSEAPEAWFRYLRHRDSANLERVVAHNRQDLLSLVGLLPTLCDVHRDPLRYGANPLPIARNIYQCAGDPAGALALLKRARSTLEPDGLLELARWARRHGELSLAVTLWEGLAAQGDQEALEALAKHLEHDRRDFARALELARRLHPPHRHTPRLERLKSKLDHQRRR